MYRGRTVPEPTVADELDFDALPETIQCIAQRMLIGNRDVRDDGRLVNTSHESGPYPPSYPDAAIKARH